MKKEESLKFGKIDNLCVNAIRILSIEAIEKAKSGHPGMPLGAAPMAYVLWTRFLKHNPENPEWFNRDRFILSAGHGSMLLYSLLYLTGYDLSIDDIKQFRQWGSKTPGHPEYGVTAGVEVTTGPLGQGFGMGVGMAIAEKFLASLFNREGLPLVDHRTFAIVSDGDLMEGISSEAASLAGTLKLGKLIYLYDQNFITIEGRTEECFTEDVKKRFESYQWHTLSVEDGNNLEEIAEAIKKSEEEKDRPSLILVKTHIGYGSPKQDSENSHGAPLGEEAVEKTRENLGWDYPPFSIPQEILDFARKTVERGKLLENEWNQMLEKYSKEYPAEYKEFERFIRSDFSTNIKDLLMKFSPEEEVATRSASGKFLNKLADKIKVFIGGSADLAPSVKTFINEGGIFSAENPGGRNIRFGVREHAMGAILNGMARHSGVLPFGGTFLVFSDYMRPSIRLSAMMKNRVIFLFSHDSIGVGEDGPTHQPIEHIMSLRLIPGLTVLRPADANETVVCWKVAIEREGPSAIILTRQKVPVLDPEKYPVFEGVSRGGYVIKDPPRKPDVILIGTGSEVHLILSASENLEQKGISVRVVSMPSMEIFEEQDEEYKRSVLIPDVPKMAVEAGVTTGWERYVGSRGIVFGINRFGASAPGKTVFKEYGFTVENLVDSLEGILNRK